MKKNFLPIPDAPKYEVNSQFIVRNIKTKHVIKPDKFGWVHLYNTGIKRAMTYSAECARRKAVAAANTKTKWYTIPSAPNYEMTKRGVVRHKVTKNTPKLYERNRYELSLSKHGQRVKRSISSLKHEVFGIVPTTKQTRRPCTIERNGKILHFDTMRAAAKFLVQENSYSLSYFANHFSRRDKIICGWAVTYLFDLTTRAGK